MKTTKRYPYTKQGAEEAIAQAIIDFGPNVASGPLSYRNAGIRSCDGLVAFSFVQSPRQRGIYRQIPYAS